MVWKIKGTGSPVIDVYETFNGDLYFIVEQNGSEILCYARLYSMPDCQEWGWNDLNYLKSVYGKYKFWKVDPKNWENIDTYEKGLLVEVES